MRPEQIFAYKFSILLSNLYQTLDSASIPKNQLTLFEQLSTKYDINKERLRNNNEPWLKENR